MEGQVPDSIVGLISSLDVPIDFLDKNKSGRGEEAYKGSLRNGETNNGNIFFMSNMVKSFKIFPDINFYTSEVVGSSQNHNIRIWSA